MPEKHVVSADGLPGSLGCLPSPTVPPTTGLHAWLLWPALLQQLLPVAASRPWLACPSCVAFSESLTP